MRDKGHSSWTARAARAASAAATAAFQWHRPVGGFERLFCMIAEEQVPVAAWRRIGSGDGMALVQAAGRRGGEAGDEHLPRIAVTGRDHT